MAVDPVDEEGVVPPSDSTIELKRVLVAVEQAGLDSFLDCVLGDGLQAIGATQGSLLLLNIHEDVLEIIKRRGPPHNPEKKKHRRFKVGEGIAGWVAEQCRPYLSPDVKEDPSFKQPLGELNFRSLLAVPIAREGRAVGVICADSPEPNKFTQEHVERLCQLAQGVAEAIDHRAVHTFIHYTKRLKQLDRIHEVGQELNRIIFESPEEYLKIVSEIVKDAEGVLEADLVTLYLYYAQKDHFETPPTCAGDFRHAEWMNSPVYPGDVPDRIVKEGQVHYSLIARKDPSMRAGEVVPARDALPERPPFVDREGVVSSAGIPLWAGKEIVGVMFINYRNPHPFPDDERHVIETFATYAALAIQGHRRFREELRARKAEALHLSSRSVAHRLRNVLPFISDRIHRTLERGMMTGEGVRWLAAALEETRRAQNIVSDFETFSRAAVFERPDVLSGAALAEKLGAVTRQALTQANATVEVRVFRDQPSDETVAPESQGPPRFVKVSLERLRDDFANFVRDSERHRPAGLRITVACDLASQADVWRLGLKGESSYLRLVYSDNGPGVPLTLKQRIFEPFYTTTMSGSGLGLAIAKYSARVHGGTLVECGKHGEGARFEFYLPIGGLRGGRVDKHE